MKHVLTTGAAGFIGTALALRLLERDDRVYGIDNLNDKVTRGDQIIMLSENESTFITLGTKHRLENPSNIPLEIIEVQSGGYLGEDDIVRFDDHYDRHKN